MRIKPEVEFKIHTHTSRENAYSQMLVVGIIDFSTTLIYTQICFAFECHLFFPSFYLLSFY